MLLVLANLVYPISSHISYKVGTECMNIKKQMQQNTKNATLIVNVFQMSLNQLIALCLLNFSQIIGQTEFNYFYCFKTIINGNRLSYYLQLKMKKYSIISTEKREKLIKQVIEDNLGVARTARKLKIKLSTAKSILRAFRNRGKILKKDIIRRKKIVKHIEDEVVLRSETQKIDGPIETPQEPQQIKKEESQITHEEIAMYQLFMTNYYNYFPMFYQFPI